MNRRTLVSRMLLGCTLPLGRFAPALAVPAVQAVWNFDNLDKIGGLTPRVEGHPKVIDTAYGKAIEFNGVNDALFFDQHPLAGDTEFTFEAIFRPDGGDPSQRWFHIAEVDPRTGRDSLPTGTNDPNPRFTFELRLVDQDKWYLDAFTAGPGYSMPLQFADKTHPIGHWYAVAQRYDGKIYRSYVDGVPQGEATIDFKPQGPGHTSVGTRINRVNYFRGAVMQARFTPRALAPEEFIKVPAPVLPPPGPNAAPRAP
jgi:hypothetical protein